MDFPLINGRRYSFASCRLRIGGREITGFKEISYTHSMERTKVRGVGAQPLGMTRGEYEAEGSVVLYREDWDELRDALGDGFMESIFDIAVSYADEGQTTKTDELRGCSFASNEKNPSQGTDALEVSLDLDVTYILENGKKPLRNMRV
jgi:hypothetical protein